MISDGNVWSGVSKGNFMRQVLFSVLLVFGLNVSAVAEDFDTALAAVKSGDFTTALRLWTSLAAQGDAKSQVKLGWMSEKGRGVKKDHKVAFTWYLQAAEQGYGEARYKVGTMYHKGQGVRQHYKSALKWYTLSAEQGVTAAQTILAYIYTNGHGVRQDYVHAHMWGNVAAFNGGEFDAELRNLLASKMTLAQIAKAQDLSRECVAKDYKGC